MSNDHNQPSSGESGGGDSDTESRGGKGSSNKKRGLFPKQATNILRAWLFQNLSVSITTYASKIDQNRLNSGLKYWYLDRECSKAKRHKTIKCRLGKLQQSFSNLAFTERSPGQLPDKILIYHQIDFNQLLLLPIIRVCLMMNSPCERVK